MTERLQCVEDRVDRLRQTLNVLLRTQQNLTSQIDYKIYGPPKELEKFSAVEIAVTHGYWGHGSHKHVFEYVPALEAKPGKTLVGGELGPSGA